MIVPDVNLLVYAEIDAFPEHARARRWWEAALGATRPVGLTAVSVFGFLRIATNRRVFQRPLTVDDALRRARAWLASPNVVLLAPGPRHLDIAFDLLGRIGGAGNLVTDVQLAAYAIENQAELCSNDVDFGRFPGLRWENPLA
jgi:hypothetical protein